MSLTANYTFVGRGNWTLDGVRGQATSGGVVSAIVAEGSRIEAAFLFGSTFSGGTVTSANLARGSDSITVGGFSALGVTSSLQAFRADVTAFMRDVIGNGDDEAFNFNLLGIAGSGVDGFTLVVVYSNPNESFRTINLLDGFSAAGGDVFQLDFAEPVDTGRVAFVALMSLGIGFSAGDEQFSRIPVDGRQLTTSAGGPYDGQLTNGALITIGSIGDDPPNPDPDLKGRPVPTTSCTT